MRTQLMILGTKAHCDKKWKHKLNNWLKYQSIDPTFRVNLDI